MKKQEQAIPLRSVIILPRWLMVGGVALGVACMLGGVGLIVFAFGWTEGGARYGALGGAFGCLIGGAGGLFGTLCDWRRRLPATIYLQHIHHDEPALMYRRAFKPAVVALVLGLVVGCFLWNNPAIWFGVVQPMGILSFISGVQEAIRRHSTQQARAVFALYADGVLEPEDTAAIEDARQKDPEFDADVLAYLQISKQVDAFALGAAPD